MLRLISLVFILLFSSAAIAQTVEPRVVMREATCLDIKFFFAKVAEEKFEPILMDEIADEVDEHSVKSIFMNKDKEGIVVTIMPTIKVACIIEVYRKIKLHESFDSNKLFEKK